MRSSEKSIPVSTHRLTDEELNLPRTVVGYPDFSAKKLMEQELNKVNQANVASKLTKSLINPTR